jgi:prepilin-type N-terminal cleavage/methylation domain-containing protein
VPLFNRSAGFTLIELMAVVAISGILAIIAVVGLRRHVANAKSAEARAALGAIGKGAARALEREASTSGVLTAGTSGVVSRRLCLSATAVVPVDLASIRGRKYQSSGAAGQDFHKDDSAIHTGFACTRFEMMNPQSYQYNYVSDATSSTQGTAITATAIGDVNGSTSAGAGEQGQGGGHAYGYGQDVGVYSTFQLSGALQSQALVLAPSLLEINPDD